MSETQTSDSKGVIGKSGGDRLLAALAGNSVAANLTMLVMLIGGFFAWKNLTTQVFPTLDLGIASISVPYPGATPSEVEEGITRRLEEAILGIDGVDRVRSTALENYGVVSAELKDRVDLVKVRNDIETAVDRLADFPPLDAENPDVVIAETVSDVMAWRMSGGSNAPSVRIVWNWSVRFAIGSGLSSRV